MFQCNIDLTGNLWIELQPIRIQYHKKFQRKMMKEGTIISQKEDQFTLQCEHLFSPPDDTSHIHWFCQEVQNDETGNVGHNVRYFIMTKAITTPYSLDIKPNQIAD